MSYSRVSAPRVDVEGWLGDGEYLVPNGTVKVNLNGEEGTSRLDKTLLGSKFKLDV